MQNNKSNPAKSKSMQDRVEFSDEANSIVDSNSSSSSSKSKSKSKNK